MLGDDIVIFDKYLAGRYLEVMQHLGVPINTMKSVVSVGKPVVEFAKRTSVNSIDVSPLSFKMFLSQNTFLGKISLCHYFANKAIRLPINRLFNILIASSL